MLISVSQLMLESLLKGGKKTLKMSQVNFIGLVMFQPFYNSVLKWKDFFFCSEVFEIYEPFKLFVGNIRKWQITDICLLPQILSSLGEVLPLYYVSLAKTWQNRGLIPSWPSSVTTGSVKEKISIGFNGQKMRLLSNII